MGKVIGYGKLGRSMPLTLEKCGNLGGDVEMVAVVRELALRHPQDTFVLVGRNSGERPYEIGLPGNVVNPWAKWRDELRVALRRSDVRGNLAPEGHKTVLNIFRDIMGDIWTKLDGLVLWVGQHGSSNMAIPKIDNRSELTKPQDWCAFYAGYMLDGVNQFRQRNPLRYEEVWLNADARNKHKMRDLKWPLRHPILTQFNFTNTLKHERYGDNDFPGDNWKDIAETADSDARVWTSRVENVYSRLEVNGLSPGTPFGDLIRWSSDFDRPHGFGMFINEARAIGVAKGMDRLSVLREWVMPLEPDWLHGSWSNASQASLGRQITPAPWNEYYVRLNSTRCTFTTPSSGSGWATAKPWEAFAGGTVCFFHPAYDTQDNILGDADPQLRDWLRVKTPAELRDRVNAVNASSSTFQWLITAQRRHFDAAMREKRYLQLIEKRIYE